MKVGIRLPIMGALATPAALAAVAERGEALGYDSLWVTEHFALPERVATLYGYGASGTPVWTADSPHLEVLTTLAWIAARTTRVRVGTSVLVLPYRNPIVLAKAIVTLDRLSGGRAVLGVGAGWLREEFDTLGVPFEERGARTREYLEALRALWSQARPTYAGRHVRLDGGFGFEPKPAQRPWPPIWIGGESRAALERVVDLGDAWHPAGLTLDALAEKLGQLRELCRERGRAYEEIEIAVRVLPAKELPADYLDRLAELGVSHVVFDPAYSHTDLDAYLEEVERYAQLIEAAHALGIGRPRQLD
jgi:probable F420-dependent oxidoreductase